MILEHCCWYSHEVCTMTAKNSRHLTVPCLLPLALTGLLTACTTLDDFKKMTPDQRARQVCDQLQSVRLYNQQIEALSGQIGESQLALARGYKIHKQCQQVKVYGNPTTTCTTQGNQTTCKETRPESHETRCTETPAPISPDLERNNITQWSMTISTLENNKQLEWRRCYDSIYPLPPEEAYRHL